MSRVQRVRSLTGRAARAALRVTLPWVHALPPSRWVHARLKAAMPGTWERVRLRVFPPPPPAPPPAPDFELPPPVSPTSPPPPRKGPPAWEPAQAQLAAALLAAAGYTTTPPADENDTLAAPSDPA